MEYAGVLAGTDYPEAAGELIDYMLSVEFQETIPLTWFVFPVNEAAQLPPEFVEHTTIPPTRQARPGHRRREPRPMDRRVGWGDGGLMRPIRWGHVLVAAVPALFIGYFFLYPLIRILTLGLSELNIGFDGVEARLFQVGWFTLWQAVLSTVLTVVVAAPMTWAVSQFEFRGRRLATALVTVPFVLPTVVVGTAFVALGWRDSIGAILAAHVFFNLAVVVRTVGALWSRLDPDLHDAGRVLGASEWKVFRTITLPLLRPAIAAASSIVFLFTFTSFGVVLILGGFRYATLEVEIYRQAVTLFDLPLAAALAVVQLVGVTATLYAYSRYQERHTSTWALRPRRTGRSPRGRARFLVGVSVIRTLIALAIPFVVMVARSLRGVAYAGLFETIRWLAHLSRRWVTACVSPSWRW